MCLNSGYIKDGHEKYLTGWLRHNWRKSDGKEIANRELWEKIAALTEARKVTFHKIKVHSGDLDYDCVGALAGAAANKAIQRAFCASQDAG